MKKLGLVVVAMAMITGVAFANSISIPWYVDFAAADGTLPPAAGGIASAVFINNSTGSDIVAHIRYFTQTGADIGPEDHNSGGSGNSFNVPALSTVAARLAVDDEVQEASPGGRDIPNRPLDGDGNDGKKNGSAVITYVGAAGDLNGQITTWDSSNIGTGGTAAIYGYQHVLESGK
jgi:hypothetical protein